MTIFVLQRAATASWWLKVFLKLNYFFCSSNWNVCIFKHPEEIEVVALTRSDSQRCDLDELAEQLDPLWQRLTLQDLRGDPVLHLTAALQYQLQVQGAPAGLLSVKHVTHKLHLQETEVGICWFISNWHDLFKPGLSQFHWPHAHSWRAPSQTPPADWLLPLLTYHEVYCHLVSSGSLREGGAESAGSDIIRNIKLTESKRPSEITSWEVQIVCYGSPFERQKYQ